MVKNIFFSRKMENEHLCKTLQFEVADFIYFLNAAVCEMPETGHYI